jgi:WD40 repeat protein
MIPLSLGDRLGVITFKLDGEARLTGMALNPAGNRLAFPSPAGVVQIDDAEHGRELRTFEGGKEGVSILEVSILEFSPEGTRLAASDASGTLRIWDLAAGREVCTADLKDFHRFHLRFSSDGQRLAVAGGVSSVEHLGEIRILDAESGRETSPRLKGHMS